LLTSAVDENQWSFSFTPLPLYPQRKSHCYPLDRQLGGCDFNSSKI